jgi:voltage-gated potassium channel
MEGARERWQRRADGPLTAAALLFLGAWSWPILQPGISHGWHRACDVAAWAVWAIFALDYGIRFVLSRDRMGFVRHSVLDLLIVVLPIFRPLRLLRLVKLLGVFNRRAGTSLRGRVAAYVIGGTALVLYVAAVAELNAERGHPHAQIRSFGESLWWSITTVTTVGYGDHSPTTTEGKWIAAGLMVAGITLLGVVTATFASWLVERVAAEEEEIQRVTREDVVELVEEVRSLRTEIAELRAERDGEESAPRRT